MVFLVKIQTDTLSSDGEIVISRQNDNVASAEVAATIALKMLCDIQSIHVPLLEGKLLPWKAAIHSGKLAFIHSSRCPKTPFL